MSPCTIFVISSTERRQYEIDTVSVRAWHCNESSGVTELPKDWPAQFHSHDTYVVRWIYKVSLTGERMG